MKTTRFLFAVVGLGAFTLGSVLAGEPTKRTSVQSVSGNHSPGPRPAAPVRGLEERTTGRRPRANSRGSTGSGRIAPINFPGRSKPPAQPSPPALNKTVPAAGNGLMLHKTPNHNEPLLRLPPVSGNPGGLTGAIRSRSPSAPVIGGMANSIIKNPAPTINGTGMKHRP